MNATIHHWLRISATAFLLGAALAVGGVAAADSHSQEGRTAGNFHVDGSYARLAGNGFSANANQCVIYSTNSQAWNQNFTSSVQIQAGVVRCNGVSLAGTCPSGRVFVERYNGSSYFCTPGYTFTNNTAYDATTYRNGTTSTTFTGSINGASSTQGGFGLDEVTYGRTWGEATGVGNSTASRTCPDPSRGTFAIWKRYDTTSGWHTITGSARLRSSSNMVNVPCWPTISDTNSSGGYEVD